MLKTVNRRDCAFMNRGLGTAHGAPLYGSAKLEAHVEVNGYVRKTTSAAMSIVLALFPASQA